MRLRLRLVLLSIIAVVGCERKAAVDTKAVITSQPALVDYGPLTDFKLIERDGSSVGLNTLLGRVWLVNFIFTRCHGPCPLMSGHMKELAQHFEANEGLRFASISTDPVHDTPDVLRAYASRFGAGEGERARRWLFMTGDKTEIIRLARDVMKLSAGEEPDMHSARFVLIDQAGHIRGWYDSLAPDFQKRLRADAAALASTPKAASPAH